MTRADNDLDEFGKRALSPLRQVPSLDPQTGASEKVRFLLRAENLRNALIPNQAAIQSKQADRKSGIFRGKLSVPIYKALAIALLVLFFVVGSSFTVYAAQASLPGDPLYTIKSVSEDLRLTLTVSPQDKLNLTLDYTNLRMGEIQSLVSKGKSLSDQTSDRYQQELEDAIQLAAQLDDQQMQHALAEIKIQAENQGITMEELISRLPDQAFPAFVHLQERLKEQVQLSTLGQDNPQQFRKDVQLRARNRHGPKLSPSAEEPGSLPLLATAAPSSNEDNNGNGNGNNHPSNDPGQGNPGNGQGQSTPGNGNHGPNPTHTPEP